MIDNTPQYHEARWRNAVADSSLKRQHRKDRDPMQRWNKMAGDFAQRTSDKENDDKRRQTLGWLQELGALKPGISILDIGAGPGNWALPFARYGANVTALEPSSAMIEILKKRAGEKNIDNITIRQATWQEIDLEAMGWRNSFDLVFASMTPGIDGPATLDKMTAACRPETGFCYLSAFAGRNWQHWYGELWQILIGEKLTGHLNDIIYPFNLIYSKGYRPHLRFDSWNRAIDWPREKAIEDFITHFESYLEITEEVRNTINTYVDQNLRNGRFRDTRKGCRGMMVWSLGFRAFALDNDKEQT